MNKFKLVLLSFGNINISVLCLFDIIIKNSIIKFFMIFILLSFLNFLQKTTNIEQPFLLDRLLYSKIYESFMLLPLIRYFYLLTENIFNKHTIFLGDNLKYNNFYLINLGEENNLNIFSFNNLHDIKSYKRYKNELLWNELLYHANNLKRYYLYRLGKISDKEYQNYFVKIEYKSTFPYLIFVIRFLPLLDGVALIHEYEPKTRNKNHKNTYEFDIIYSTDIFEDINNERCINEPKIIKERESFIYGFLLCSEAYAQFFYESKLNTYYSEEILDIIRKIIETNELDSSLNINYLLNIILQSLYKEYLKCLLQNLDNHSNIKDKDKDIKTILNTKLTEKINEDKNEIVNNNQWNYSNYYHNKNLFKMTKIYYLLSLFKPTDNISRYKNNFEDNYSDKYEYINIDLKKAFHKSIDLTLKFSYENNTNNNTINDNYENNSVKNKSSSLNQILSKPLSNYDGPNNFYSYQSTNNISSNVNKNPKDEDTFCSLKNSIFELNSSL